MLLRGQVVAGGINTNACKEVMIASELVISPEELSVSEGDTVDVEVALSHPLSAVSMVPLTLSTTGGGEVSVSPVEGTLSSLDYSLPAEVSAASDWEAESEESFQLGIRARDLTGPERTLWGDHVCKAGDNGWPRGVRVGTWTSWPSDSALNSCARPGPGLSFSVAGVVPENQAITISVRDSIIVEEGSDATIVFEPSAALPEEARLRIEFDVTDATIRHNGNSGARADPGSDYVIEPGSKHGCYREANGTEVKTNENYATCETGGSWSAPTCTVTVGGAPTTIIATTGTLNGGTCAAAGTWNLLLDREASTSEQISIKTQDDTSDEGHFEYIRAVINVHRPDGEAVLSDIRGLYKDRGLEL